MLPSLARMAFKASLSGLEFAVGIPATLGGAIVMNAGAFGQDIGIACSGKWRLSILRGNRRELSRDELTFRLPKILFTGQKHYYFKSCPSIEAG